MRCTLPPLKAAGAGERGRSATEARMLQKAVAGMVAVVLAGAVYGLSGCPLTDRRSPPDPHPDPVPGGMDAVVILPAPQERVLGPEGRRPHVLRSLGGSVAPDLRAKAPRKRYVTDSAAWAALWR